MSHMFVHECLCYKCIYCLFVHVYNIVKSSLTRLSETPLQQGVLRACHFYLQSLKTRRSRAARARLKTLKIYIEFSDFNIPSEMAGKIKVADDCSYKTYSVCESAADSSSSSRVEEGGESDAPAVFMCGKCKLPIGDSLYWAGSDDEHNQIMLKRKRLCFYGSSL